MKYVTLIIFSRHTPGPMQVAVPQHVAADIVARFNSVDEADMPERIGYKNVECRPDTVPWALRTQEIVAMFVDDNVQPVRQQYLDQQHQLAQQPGRQLGGWRS